MLAQGQPLPVIVNVSAPIAVTVRVGRSQSSCGRRLDHEETKITPVAFIVVVFLTVGLAGCGRSGTSADDPCLAIVHEYAAAMPDALVCDPNAPDSCGAGRPLTVSEQAADGSITLRGVCMAPCLGAVDPQRTAGLDGILARFQAQGCSLVPCWCPPPQAMPATCTPAGTCWGLATGY